MRAWISRGRNWLSNSIAICPSRVRSPLAAARNCSSAGTIGEVTQRAWLCATGNAETGVTTLRNEPYCSCSTTQSTHAVSAVTSVGSTAGNMPIRSWLRPSLR